MQYGTTRPYGTTGLTRATWQRVPLRWINLDDLVFTQDGVYLENLLRHPHTSLTDYPPQVVEHHGTLYLEDGHSRVARALIRGVREARCRVWTTT